MRTSHFIPDPEQLGNPECERCGAYMWLARIEPEKPDHDRRIFECPQCERSVTQVVKYK